MAVMGCYRRGFFWEEKTDTPYTDTVYLYEILDNCSCFWCRNKNLKELRAIYKYLPEYWERLKQMQERTQKPFRLDNTIFDLEIRFKSEQRIKFY